MPRQREDEAMLREHVWLFASDIDWINRFFGSNIGKSKAIRQMVRVMRKQIEAKSLANANHPKVEDILGDEDISMNNKKAAQTANPQSTQPKEEIL